MTQPSASIYVLLAREAPVGVLIRRGPSSQTQLIKWNLNDDTFEEGQWHNDMEAPLSALIL